MQTVRFLQSGQRLILPGPSITGGPFLCRNKNSGADRGHGEGGAPLYLSCLMLAELYVGKRLGPAPDICFQFLAKSRAYKPSVCRTAEFRYQILCASSSQGERFMNVCFT